MTEEELEVQRCLDKVFEYCKSHKGTCKGCIFFKYTQIGNIGIASCKITYAPEVFGESQGDSND